VQIQSVKTFFGAGRVKLTLPQSKALEHIDTSLRRKRRFSGNSVAYRVGVNDTLTAISRAINILKDGDEPTIGQGIDTLTTVLKQAKKRVWA